MFFLFCGMGFLGIFLGIGGGFFKDIGEFVEDIFFKGWVFEVIRGVVFFVWMKLYLMCCSVEWWRYFLFCRENLGEGIVILVYLLCKCGIVESRVKLIEEYEMKVVVGVFLVFFIFVNGKY